MEEGLCFMSMILHTSSDLQGTANTRQRIKQRLVAWVDKKYQILASSTVLCVETQMNRKRGIITIRESENISITHLQG